VLPGLHERGAGSRIRLGLLSALWYATPRVKPRRFKFTPSTCGNNARNSMATTDDLVLLDRAVSNHLKAELRNDRSSFSRERSDGDCGFWRFNAHDLGDILSSHRASELTGSGGCRTTTTPGSWLLKLIDPSCFPSSLRFAPSSFRLRLPVCDRFREPHDFT
jgi:hypothetical protein